MLLLCAQLSKPYTETFWFIALVNSIDAQFSASVFPGKCSAAYLTDQHTGKKKLFPYFTFVLRWTAERFSFVCIKRNEELLLLYDFIEKRLI